MKATSPESRTAGQAARTAAGADWARTSLFQASGLLAAWGEIQTRSRVIAASDLFPMEGGSPARIDPLLEHFEANSGHRIPSSARSVPPAASSTGTDPSPESKHTGPRPRKAGILPAQSVA